MDHTATQATSAVVDLIKERDEARQVLNDYLQGQGGRFVGLWRDATVDAPPDGEEVLAAMDDGEMKFARYHESRSVSKGCALPNATATACWSTERWEGKYNIRWWAHIRSPK